MHECKALLMEIIRHLKLNNLERRKKLMELGKRIKHYRNEKALTQDNLAQRVYVSRQTISNWENDKSYPDINSIVLLSEVLEVSIDNLIRGDVEQMKIEMDTEEVKKLNLYGWGMLLFLLLTIVSVIPFAKFFGLYAVIPVGGLWGIAMFFALKIERIKKNNNIHTYKEILAFKEGKGLDEIQQIAEKAKRPYQKVLLVLGTVLVGALLCGIAAMIFR